MTRLFDRPGPANTQDALAVIEEGIEVFQVRQLVVASTHGDTGLAVARLLAGRGLTVVVVTHNCGFKEPGRLEMSAATRQEIEALGAKVHTGTMPFRTIGTAIRGLVGYSQQDLVANTLRLLGQGIKVCVEIALMASDAGLITPEEVLTVAGTGRGADTVALLLPQPSNRLFDLQVRAVLAKPRIW
ncbi:MAG: hypothetical protein AB1634_05840 [Thermodesulfobacteriota bacterium]